MSVIDITEAIEDRDAARKSRRAQRERERYSMRIEVERARCRTRKQSQRSREGREFPPQAGGRYEPGDYAEEWTFLTMLGVRSDLIIERSRPTRAWFAKYILPRVTRSLCATCGDLFNPQDSTFLTRCSRTCGLNDEA